MPRPKTKNELIHASDANYKALNEFIDSLPSNLQSAEFSADTLNRNIRDVLGHLHHWHLMMIEWYKVGMKGDKPDIPAKGYTWKTLPELNREINTIYRTKPLSDIRFELNKSYQLLQEIIQSHSNKELFEKKRYHWTGSTSLGAYLISATSSHYDWALKLIRKSVKALG